MIDAFTAADLQDAPRMARHDAAAALERTASAYRLIAHMPRMFRREAARVCVVRPYLFERNLGRWPDGLFHLLDRSYEPWLGHEIACHDETLRTIGAIAWGNSKAVRVGFTQGCIPLVDDVFQNGPPPRFLPELAAILDRLARHLKHG